MQSEERSHHQAAPSQARSTLQNQKQKHRIRRMEKDVDDMGALRVQAENLAIESMREPGDRVPVRRFRSMKSPNEGVPGESGTNLGIIGDIYDVVKIEKRSARDRVIECNRRQNQQQAENQFSLREDCVVTGRSLS